METGLKHFPLWVKLLLVLSLLAFAGAGLSLVPSNYVAVAPHKPVDLKGRLHIDGQLAEPADGRLFLVGVTEAKVSLVEKWLLEMDPKVNFTRAPTAEERRNDGDRDKAAIVQSKEVAGAAAYQMLGRPVQITGGGAVVSGLAPDGPARLLLRPGDIIRRVNAAPVQTAADVTKVVGSAAPGTPLNFIVRRAGRSIAVTVRTAPPVPGDQVHRSRIGVSLSTPQLKIRLPREIKFNTKEIVGPSAGLAFALAIYDAESAVDLLRGRYVVATGALALDGEVLAVGGVRQKAIAANDAGYDIIMVPRANVKEATTAVREFCSSSECTKVLGVASVEEAVRLLEMDRATISSEFAN